MSEEFIIRPYRREDRQAIRDICAATCWMGEYRPERIPDDWIWSEYWTRYFTDREPQHTWVVCPRGQDTVLGYLNGTADVRRFEKYALRLMPGIAWHVVRRRLMRRRNSRRALLAMLRSMLTGEMKLPPGVARRYPATWHFDLLAQARRGGAGWRLYSTFVETMRSLGVPGVHAQPLSINPAVGKFLRKAGFTRVAHWPVRAFDHVEDRPIELETWVLDLA